MEKGQVKRESGRSGMDEEAEIKAIQDWLRFVDKPLAKEKHNRKDAEQSGE